jgi:hypothetical protein
LSKSGITPPRRYAPLLPEGGDKTLIY